MEPFVPAVDPWRYRNKMEYRFGGRSADGRPRRSAFTRAAAGTASTMRATACSRRSATTPRATWCATGARAQGLSAYDRRAQEGFLRNLVVREGRRTGDLQVRLVTRRATSASMRSPRTLRERFPGASFLWTRIEGPPRARTEA